MGHCRHAPEQDRERKAFARSQPVHESAGKQQASRIGELEGEDDIAVVNLIPPDLALKSLLQQSNDLAINVVDGCGNEQQRTNHPAVVRDRLRKTGAYSGQYRFTGGTDGFRNCCLPFFFLLVYSHA